MPIAPEITLTVTLDDLSGIAIANAALSITLCGYGQTLPRVQGAAMLAKTGPMTFRLANGASAGIKLWGNDQITPGGTYYAIETIDDKGNVIQSGIYQFTGGTQTIDLSVAAQTVDPPTPPAPIPPGNYFADSIAPTGVIDGANAIFTLPQAPSPAASLKLFKNGQRMTQGVAYALDQETITYAADYIPQIGDSHISDYRYFVAP